VAAPDDVLSPEHSARLADLQRQGDALFRASNQFIASIGQVTYIYIYMYIYIYIYIYLCIYTHPPTGNQDPQTGNRDPAERALDLDSRFVDLDSRLVDPDSRFIIIHR
jgi:hypothetical protein